MNFKKRFKLGRKIAKSDILKIKELNSQRLMDENNLLKKKLIEFTNKETEGETIETDGYKSEKIKVNIPKLKSVLYTRLKIYHEKHIDNLMNQYDLENKTELDKQTMEKLLLEAIHFN